MQQPILEVSDLHYKAGSRLLFNGLSLKLHPGERLGIYGRSGSGKSTLLRLLAGLIAPQRGTIRIDGVKVTQGRRILLPPEQRRIGFVFQDIALWPHLTLERNLVFPIMRIPRKNRVVRVVNTLKRIGLEGRGGDYPARLSGGEQQRAALGRALIHDPELLLLDEPFTALDSDLRAEMIRWSLQLIAERNMTVLLVSHRTEDLVEFCTRQTQL